MRIVFLGTPDFSVPILQALIASEFRPFAVITQPDRPKGRGKQLTAPPVKDCALAHDIPVYQFEKIKSPEGAQTLRELAPDLMVTAAFGQILSAENLAVPPLGCINVHASLLPKYRGASPIQWSIINGEAVTGVTTMYTELGVDCGDIILQKETAILPEETGGELFDRLSLLGAELIVETLRQVAAGTAPRIPQQHELATKCGMLDKSAGNICWVDTAKNIHNLVRGIDPWPGAFTHIGTEVLKIWKVTPTGEASHTQPGTILRANAREGLFVACGDGVLEILELQPAGGRRMSAREYLRAHTLPVGDQFRGEL